jgi:hypothetical protein
MLGLSHPDLMLASMQPLSKAEEKFLEKSRLMTLAKPSVDLEWAYGV